MELCTKLWEKCQKLTFCQSFEHNFLTAKCARALHLETKPSLQYSTRNVYYTAIQDGEKTLHVRQYKLQNNNSLDQGYGNILTKCTCAVVILIV